MSPALAEKEEVRIMDVILDNVTSQFLVPLFKASTNIARVIRLRINTRIQFFCWDGSVVTLPWVASSSTVVAIRDFSWAEILKFSRKNTRERRR